MRSIRLLFVLVALSLGLVAAGCGGGSGTVPGGVAADVSGDQIRISEVDHLLDQAKIRYKNGGQKFPDVGTEDYRKIRNDALQFLVTQAELEQKAKGMDIKVSDAEVNKELKQFVDSVAQGNRKRFFTLAKRSSGLSPADVRLQLRRTILSRKLQTEVTKDVKVSSDDVKKYYDDHKSAYRRPESRHVQHLLVRANQRGLANRLYARARGGADFTRLVKKYSIDPSAKTNDGKFDVTQTGFDPAFTKVAFKLKTGALSQPVKSQAGWHLIKALGPRKPPGLQPFAEAAPQIRQLLLQQKKNEAALKWYNDLKKEYSSKVKYQVGYAPRKTTQQTTT